MRTTLVSITLLKNSYQPFLNQQMISMMKFITIVMIIVIDNSNHSYNDKQNEDFSILHINSRSISKNFDSLETLLHSLNKFSFCVIGISETWLNKNSPDMFNIQDYEMIHADRKEGRGGGVALYIRKTIKIQIKKRYSLSGCCRIFLLNLKISSEKKHYSRYFV